MPCNFETLEKILYNDTFFKSTLTTFDKENGKDIRSKEINMFMAKSFLDMKARQNEETSGTDHDNLIISVDYRA
jgi:hypothetical protein